MVPISGTSSRFGEWTHQAFVPDPLPNESPELSTAAHLVVADARDALARLDSTARQLPNPALLRRPTLRIEAQSTSALEGTYAPLDAVLTADQDDDGSPNMREVLNYELMAANAFHWIEEGRALTVSLLSELQRRLVRDTPKDGPASGRIRTSQVVIGQRADAPVGSNPVLSARFVPSPHGADLEANVRDLLDWMQHDHSGHIDPVVAAGMAHYQFETLHPFHDGNGRLGRLLVVAQFQLAGVLSEPTLSVSPWFEARRAEYYDRLLGVSTQGNWDAWVRHFAAGITESAKQTHRRMLAVLRAREELKDVVRASNLRADTALMVVDYAVGHTVQCEGRAARTSAFVWAGESTSATAR